MKKTLDLGCGAEIRNPFGADEIYGIDLATRPDRPPNVVIADLAVESIPYEDNYFDLAIVDPPYGLGNKTTQGGSKRNSNANFKSHEWDNSIPNKEYFKELKRFSKRA